ncbi:MAG TPA: hypothetical protein VGH20_17845 [Myxococcales bacterium]|jgi:chromate transport protein ChrA
MRKALLGAVVAVLAFGLPFAAEILGMQLAGSVWNALRSGSPWLSQAGELCGGILGGVVVGVALKLLARSRFWPWPVAGFAVAVAYVAWRPAALLAAPVAAGLAASLDRRPQQWTTAVAIAAALSAMANALPFPTLVSAALCAAAGIAVSAARKAPPPSARKA